MSSVAAIERIAAIPTSDPRVTHVIDNLNNVVTNSKQSRSQIEDADYAKASTDLAKAQIMQQAGTAVLAQANMSQQSVLKLLNG